MDRTVARLAGAAMVLAVPVLSPAATEPSTVPVHSMLLRGPRPAPLPAFHAERPGGYGLEDLLGEDDGVETGWPEASDAWSVAEADPDGVVAIPSGPEGTPQRATFLFYLAVPRWVEADLVVRTHHLLRVEADGKESATLSAAVPADAAAEPPQGRDRKRRARREDAGPPPGEARAHLELEPGIHRVTVVALRDPASPHPWRLSAVLEAEPDDAPILRPAIAPRREVGLEHVLDAPVPEAVAISADGSLAAVTVRRFRPESEDAESWVEVRRTADGSLERTFRGTDIADVAWAPPGHRLSYVSRDGKRASLWLVDLDGGAAQPILEAVEHLQGYLWAPDGGAVIYTVKAPAVDDDPPPLQRLLGLQDRQPDARDRAVLFRVTLPDREVRRLTAGSLGARAGAVSPDGRRVLVFRSPDDYQVRPYLRRELHIVELESLEAERVASDPWIREAVWSPDGRRLLILGGPSAFDGAGRALPEEVVPNDYDGQLYLLDPGTGEVEPLSREFDPAVEEAAWSRADGAIYLRAVAGTERGLYRLDPGSRTFRRLDAGVGVVEAMAVADDAPLAVVSGSDAAVPPRVLAVDLAGDRWRLLTAPGAEAFRSVRFGEVRPWSFVNRRGTRIDGMVYLPAGFDPAVRYPAIVNFYGGTYPITREFGGRYPKEWWTAHGYVVYVPQPSGAVGYGQEFSALHVNDWGRLAGEDVLEGVERFLEAHPFVDPARVGCIGASFGGFLTEYLLTRTERFAAAVSHAGISFLGSYWGEGLWGYSYSGVASAGSFPWNRGELYVGRSPLFHADRIRTPLLLLHGTADSNVPAGESEQLYTALKLLGRPVEYIRVAGQDHHVLKHEPRVAWSKTILAWFDLWLKGEPGWWDHLHRDPGAEPEDGPAEDRR